MIDIGVNLTNSRFDKDREDIISRAQKVGVHGLIVTGTNIQESESAYKLCQQYPEFLWSTAGVHPHDADNVNDDYIQSLRDLSQHKSVVAIGECGLDFNRNFSTPENQQRVFSEQVALAAELNMPLFLHQRDAFEHWYQILSPYFKKIPAMVAHCFTGNLKELQLCLSAGMYIGITGWLCDERRGEKLRSIVKEIPLERLLIETDAPYLTPRTIRPRPKSSRNEPSYLPYVVKEIACLLNLDESVVMSASANNAQKIFNLSVSDE